METTVEFSQLQTMEKTIQFQCLHFVDNFVEVPENQETQFYEGQRWLRWERFFPRNPHHL